MVQKALSALLQYAIQRQLIEETDKIYAANRILALIGETVFAPTAVDGDIFQTIDDMLGPLCEAAAAHGKLPIDTVTTRDVLCADIMDVLTPMPSTVIRTFDERYQTDPKAATDYFYALSRANNYIMTERVRKNIEWRADSPYGELLVTVNLSKPEKDPRDIAAAKAQRQTGYPKCLLCPENVGFEGGGNHPPRANHRTVPLTLGGERWHLQYSPYVYYPEHCIVLNDRHVPMKVDRALFAKLLEFVERFPHYFVGSNADLPIVGGSILTHDHFQGGRFDMPMALAPIEQSVTINGFEQVQAGIVKWPLSSIRLMADDPTVLADAADRVLTAWRGYTDETNDIIAHTDAPHNTITPIARKRDGRFELDLILRNNRTTDEHPLGIFHPHKEYHHIKKENIGLIEAMGLAVLPPRLKDAYDLNDADTRQMIGDVFAHILDNCGVFKNTHAGRAGFLRFIQQI